MLLVQRLLILALVELPNIPGMPGYRPNPVRPNDAVNPAYIEVLERNTHIVYPVLAVLVLVVLVAGILQAWKTQDLDGLQRAEFKREIILELRRDTLGYSVEVLARKVKLEPLKLVRLLEEMQSEGMVMSVTNSQRMTTWRLKGVGPVAR
ncbi:MAG: hypothetical protein JNK82_36655 [Myxococcaceae bacterium]|nr:hypothetical protein [Myxococcaceae bacterium]